MTDELPIRCVCGETIEKCEQFVTCGMGGWRHTSGPARGFHGCVPITSPAFEFGGQVARPEESWHAMARLR